MLVLLPLFDTLCVHTLIINNNNIGQYHAIRKLFPYLYTEHNFINVFRRFLTMSGI